MSVKTHIADLVQDALQAISHAHSCTRQLNSACALEASIRAIKKAEEAFFDDSLVSLLYFPSEHKYAVYMPFFVPFLVPIMGQFVKFGKRLRAGNFE